MFRYTRIAALAALSCLTGTSAFAFAPDFVQPSSLVVEAKYVATMPFVLGPGFFGPSPNLGSPVPIGDKLFLIDQNDAIYRVTDEGIKEVFDIVDAPAGLTLDNRQSVLNVSPGSKANRIYVAFTSGTLPVEPVPLYPMPPPLPDVCCDVDNPIPVPDLYRLGVLFGTRTEYQVFYEYKVAGNELQDPRAIAVLETQSGPTHNGGGMVTLPDGRILFATGDALPFGAEGRAGAQDPSEIVSKLVIIDPDDGSLEVAAVGVRNVQHLEYVDGSGALTIGFGDIGGVTAEEVNFVAVSDLVDTTTVENFGWGRNPDSFAREGTFFVGPGVPLVLNTQPPAVGLAPSPEMGFIQPLAQYGRTDPNGGVAVSGPVTSETSFDTITALFSDLSSGILYATIDPITGVDVPVYKVNLVDENGASLGALQDLVSLFRADPRFFRFPDGRAGVLLEATGDLYELTELPAE